MQTRCQILQNPIRPSSQRCRLLATTVIFLVSTPGVFGQSLSIPGTPGKSETPANSLPSTEPGKSTSPTPGSPPSAQQAVEPKSDLTAPPEIKPTPTPAPVSPVSQDPTLKDEEGEPAPSVSKENTGVPTLELSEDMENISGPFQYSRIPPRVLFVGKTPRERALFSLESSEGKLTHLATLKDGYTGTPIGFDEQTQSFLVQILPLQGEREWHTQVGNSFSGETISLGTFNLQRTNWLFFPFPFKAWIESLRFLVGVRNDPSHFFVSSISGEHQRFVAPLQNAERSGDIFHVFSATPKNEQVIFWIDSCRARTSQPQCLWMAPLLRKQTTLPRVHSVLPYQPKRKAHWWMDSDGSILTLSLWEQGGTVGTRRWWTRFKFKKWFPIWEGKHSDPKSRVVIVNRPPSETRFYFLVSTNGANTELAVRTVQHKTRKIVLSKQKDLSLPFLTDIFPFGNEGILSVSQGGIRVINVNGLF